MKSVIRAVAIATVALTVTACSTWTHVKAPDGRPLETERFAYQVPAGWSFQRMSRDTVTVSRDGPAIQRMNTRWYEWDKPLFYGDAERDRLQRGQLPTDIAHQILAARQRQEGIEALDVVSLTPAKVVGADGFRAEYTYRSGRGIAYSGVSYGAIRGEGVYLITFEAPSIHFYERDLPTFEQIVASGRAKAAPTARR